MHNSHHGHYGHNTNHGHYGHNNHGHYRVYRHLHRPFGGVGFNHYGVLGNVGGVHPGLLRKRLGQFSPFGGLLGANNPLLNAVSRTNNPLLNAVARNNLLTSAAVNPLVNPSLVNRGIVNNGLPGTGLANPIAVSATAAAVANAANPTLAAANGLLPGLAAQRGLVNPFLNQAALRNTIWQSGPPLLGLRQHRLLQPNHIHPGLLHPAAHQPGFTGLGYGYPFGGGVPPLVPGGHLHPINSPEHVADHVHGVPHEHVEDHPHEFPHKHPRHLPVHPEDLDFIEMNKDAPYQEPSCSRKSSKSWCIEDVRYPREQIELAGHIHAEGLMDLYADVSDLDTELSVKGHKTIYDESYLCASETSYIRPLRAVNTQGRWRVIVNNVKIHYQKLSQTVRVEECLHHGEPCPLVPYCYASTCLQKLVVHRFLVFDPFDHKFPFAIDTFRLPASCSCKMGAYFLYDYH